MNKFFSVWEGVFNSFEEAGGDTSAFETKEWLEKQKQKTLESLKVFKSSKELASINIDKDYPLAVAVAMLLSVKEKISILDFGGGMGMQYLDLIAKVPAAKEKVRFCIIEGQETLNHKPKDLEMFKNLEFFSSLDAIQGTFQIIHMGSTLQYINHWQDLLRKIINKFRPEFFVFSELVAGDVPTFVTQQHFYGKKIPYRFYNFEEFKEFMCAELSLKPIYISKFASTILGQTEVFPNFGLPLPYQLDRALNVIFKNI